MRHIIEKIIKQLFQTSLVTYLLLLLGETIEKGFVSYYFNMNILLSIVLSSGIIMLMLEFKKVTRTQYITSLINVKEWITSLVISHAAISSLIDHKILQFQNKKLKDRDFYYIFFLSLGGAAVVYYKTQNLGYVAYLISAFIFVMIGLLSYLVYIDDKDNNHKSSSKDMNGENFVSTLYD